MLEHDSVFTQGQAGKEEHILTKGEIPIVKSDRGGQVTYHGPGQLVIYFMLDLKRKSVSVRDIVNKFEQIAIDYLNTFNIEAHRVDKAPGVYIEDSKICSIGIRVRKGYSYHGLCFNVDMDLEPYSYINPCGYKNLQVTQLSDHVSDIPINKVKQDITEIINTNLNYDTI